MHTDLWGPIIANVTAEALITKTNRLYFEKSCCSRLPLEPSFLSYIHSVSLILVEKYQLLLPTLFHSERFGSLSSVELTYSLRTL